MKTVSFKLFHPNLRVATSHSIRKQVVIEESVVGGNIRALHWLYLANRNVLCHPEPPSQPVQTLNEFLGSGWWPPPISTNIVGQVVNNDGSAHDVDLSLRQHTNRIIYLMRHNDCDVQAVPLVSGDMVLHRVVFCLFSVGVCEYDASLSPQVPFRSIQVQMDLVGAQIEKVGLT